MKFSASLLVEILLVVGVVFILASQYATDLNAISPENNVTMTDITKYQFGESLNSSFSDVSTNIKNAVNTENGFFVQLANGLVAIPKAVFLLPSALFASIANVSLLIKDFLVDQWGIDPGIILAITIFIGIGALLGALEWISSRGKTSA